MVEWQGEGVRAKLLSDYNDVKVEKLVICHMRPYCRVQYCRHGYRHVKDGSCCTLRYAEIHRICPECR